MKLQNLKRIVLYLYDKLNSKRTSYMDIKIQAGTDCKLVEIANFSKWQKLDSWRNNKESLNNEAGIYLIAVSDSDLTGLPVLTFMKEICYIGESGDVSGRLSAFGTSARNAPGGNNRPGHVGGDRFRIAGCSLSKAYVSVWKGDTILALADQRKRLESVCIEYYRGKFMDIPLFNKTN